MGRRRGRWKARGGADANAAAMALFAGPTSKAVAAAWGKLLAVSAIGLLAVPGSKRAATASGVSTAAFNVLFPALLYTSTAEVVRSQPPAALEAAVLGAGVQIASAAVCGFVAASAVRLEGRAFRETVVACAFGNATTIPLLLMSGVAKAGILPADVEVSTLVGLLSLYQAGWSICLWTVGAAYLQGADADVSVPAIAARLATPPSLASLAGVAVGLAPMPAYGLLTGHVNGAALPDALALLSRAFGDGLSFLGSGAQPALALVLALSLAGGADAPGDGAPHSTIPRQLAATLAVRCLCLPLITGALDGMCATSSADLGASVRAVLILEGCQPTAQVLVLLSQVQGTPCDAGRLARLLLLQYTCALPFVVAWAGYLL